MDENLNIIDSNAPASNDQGSANKKINPMTLEQVESVTVSYENISPLDADLSPRTKDGCSIGDLQLESSPAIQAVDENPSDIMDEKLQETVVELGLDLLSDSELQVSKDLPLTNVLSPRDDILDILGNGDVKNLQGILLCTLISRFNVILD